MRRTADLCCTPFTSEDASLNAPSASVRSWFRERFGAPTTGQRLAWPVIAAGENLLLCTPTGSGKTLAGMLPILDHIRAERRQGLKCLYIAPLKALLQDACTNLRCHCLEIDKHAPKDAWPIRIELRTGDTSARAKKHQLDDPPHVLLTTPESLAVLLTHPITAEFFQSLRWVVVDELHSFVGSKRGADLTLALERLECMVHAAPVQRVGLSATCTPLSTAAQFLVGVDRPCRIVQGSDSSDLELRAEPLPFVAGPGFMNRLIARLELELLASRTTLIFTNTRSLTERVTWALRRRYPERADAIAAHHSALAPARRRLVERAMKQGRLWAAVSSTSLELGIDIGSVDGVVFVHPPGSVVRLLQRLGRSGHRPGMPKRGLVLTASPRGLAEAAVTAECGRHGEIETLRVPDHPLDVLCQHLVGMAMTGLWTTDEAFALVRRAFPYRDLSRDDFDACLDYLSGRHRDGTQWLPARLRWEGDAFAIVDDRTARLLRRNLGTIVSEEPCAVRMAAPERETTSGWPVTSLVGEVEEVYADRLAPGDRFMLDARCLELRERDGKEMLVDEVLGRPEVPRWHGAGPPMSNELARRLYLFRAAAGEALCEGPAALDRLLRGDFHLDHAAAVDLSRWLTHQETISEIPDMRTLLIEALAHPGHVEYCIHTPLPSPANQALARVVGHRLSHIRPVQATPLAADLGFLLVVERAAAIDAEQWRSLLSPFGLRDDFLAALRNSPLLRERFAHVAQTGIMVLRSPVGRRRKVGGRNWAREQLFERVRQLAPDFLLLRQAEREAAETACDVATAGAFASTIPNLEIRLRWLAEPSPFADSLLASQSATAVSSDDALQRLHTDLLSA